MMEIDENGVVNPMRAPAFVRTGVGSIRAIPTVGLVFLVLAAVALVIDWLDSRTVSPYLIGNAVTVLFPTAMLWRRPDAATATPRLFRGVVLLAIAEIATTFIRLVSSAIPVDDSFFDESTGGWARPVASAVVTLLTMVAWALIGSATARLRPPVGFGRRALGAIVAACAIVVGAGVVFLDFLAQGESLSATLIPYAVLVSASWIVTAYLGWVLISRAGGVPRRATVAAAMGVAIQTIGALPVVAVAVWILATRSADWADLQANGFAVLAAASLLAPILFTFALATGLGDPPRVAGSDTEAEVG